MSQTIETTARLRMQTILETVFSDASRVILGYADIKATDPDFWDNLIRCGPEAFILAAEIDNLDAVSKLYNFTVRVRIYFAQAPDGSNDDDSMEDFIKECWKALVTQSAYLGACIPPSSQGFHKDQDLTYKATIAGPVYCWEGKFIFIAGSQCL